MRHGASFIFSFITWTFFISVMILATRLLRPFNLVNRIHHRGVAICASPFPRADQSIEVQAQHRDEACATDHGEERRGEAFSSREVCCLCSRRSRKILNWRRSKVAEGARLGTRPVLCLREEAHLVPVLVGHEIFIAPALVHPLADLTIPANFRSADQPAVVPENDIRTICKIWSINGRRC